MPNWFIIACGVAIFGVPVVAVLAEGNWMHVAVIVGMVVPLMAEIRPILRWYQSKSPSPKDLDDLA
jgi:hypothetical protein